MTPHISVSLLRTQSDERLASLAGDGHERAFEAIVERYGKPLRRYAQRFLSEARAEEVVQAAFLSAWTALGTGTEVRDLRPWLYRIVHNGALNAMQKAESGEIELIEAPDGGISPHAALEQNEEIRSALSVIASLPERQRTALLAVAVDGRAHADVALDLGVSDAGVRQLVRRARVQLRAGVTALTPLPLALWLANGHRNTSPDVTHRIAEMLGDGGGNALASTAFKAGAVVISVTAVAAGGAEGRHNYQREQPLNASGRQDCRASWHSRRDERRDRWPRRGDRWRRATDEDFRRRRRERRPRRLDADGVRRRSSDQRRSPGRPGSGSVPGPRPAERGWRWR